MILFKPAIVGPFIIVRINCSFSCCRTFLNLPGEHMLNRISWEKWKPTWGNSFVGLVEKQLILWGFRPFKCLHLHPTSSFRLLQPVVFENSKLECFVGTQNATCTLFGFRKVTDIFMPWSGFIIAKKTIRISLTCFQQCFPCLQNSWKCFSIQFGH